MATATLSSISDSSDLVWELVCAFEDGRLVTTAQIAQLSEADQVIFTEETDAISRKRAREYAHGDYQRKMAAECKGSLAYLNAAEALQSGADAYENAILAAQED